MPLPTSPQGPFPPRPVTTSAPYARPLPTQAPLLGAAPGPAGSAPEPASPFPSKPRRRRTRRIVAAVLATAVLAGTATAALAYRDLNNNITQIDTTTALGTDRPTAQPAPPEAPHEPLNILVIGSDSRAGQKNIGGETPGLSDTTILLHVNAARTTITGVSIPRDSMVQRPTCLSKDGKTNLPAEFSMFNQAYAVGGPGCTQRTVEQLTGVRTDHFAIVDFSGFKRMVKALGGVPICVPRPVNDTIGKITLPAGAYTANPDQALNYVRERHTMSANGDLGRMKRQQAFLSAMVNKVLSAGTLTNAPRLYRFLDAATSSLTTDPDLASLASLASLAQEMQTVPARNIRFLSVPTQPYAPDPNRLQWASSAKAIWQSFRADEALPNDLRSETTSATKARTAGKVDKKVRRADQNGLCA